MDATGPVFVTLLVGAVDISGSGADIADPTLPFLIALGHRKFSPVCVVYRSNGGMGENRHQPIAPAWAQDRSSDAAPSGKVQEFLGQLHP